MSKNADLYGVFDEVTGALTALKQGGQAADILLSSIGSSTPDADAATKGKLQLAGALGGTAAAPTALGYADAAALATALALKASAAGLTAHTGDTANPHAVTKTQVGLANVDNTSDVNKPVSTAQAAADALKGTLAAVNNWALTQTSDLSAPAYAATVTLDRDTMSNHVNVGALTGNLTLANPTGYTKAVTLNVWLTQDATGGRTLTLGAKIKTAGAAGIVLSTAPNAVDVLSLVYNPTKDIWFAAIAKAVS